MNQLDDPSREQQTGHAASQCDRRTLREQQARQTPASRAQRPANRDFLFAARGARQLEVGDVGAGNDQHKTDRAQENQQSGPDVADFMFVQQENLGLRFPKATDSAGEIVQNALVDRIQLGGRRVEPLPRF